MKLANSNITVVNIDRIIQESIEKVLQEKEDNQFRDNLADFFKRKKMRDERSASERNKGKRFKTRKLKYGNTERYDYNKWKEEHGEEDLASMNDIRNKVDMEKTNIASVAREVHPDHTDQGAQSQLRKELNGERDMTTDVARKLNKMVDAGQIAVK